jgi:hypothetical protein
MRRLTVTTACLIVGIVILLLRQSTSAQEGSGSSRSSPQRATRPMTPDEFYQSFWKFINKQDAPYKKWESLPGKKEFREGESPHGELIKSYANKVAVENPGALPYGAILVTENYDKEKKLMDVTVMYRSKGSAPKHADWYWIKYLPDGSVARAPEKEGKKAIAGQVESCIKCHRQADGRDLVFSNDAEKEAEEE